MAAADGELWRVTDKRGGGLQRAFPRDPSLANDTPDPASTVGPETAPVTAEANGAPLTAEPVVIDGDALDAVVPHGMLAPSPWAGWPSDWEPSWSSGGTISGQNLTNRVSTVFTCVDLNGSALGSMPVALSERGRPMDPETYDWTTNPEPRVYASWDEFIVQVYASLGTRGDAFIHATDWDWATFLPTRFMVLDPDLVQVEFDRETGQRTYMLNGAPVFGPDLLHLRYLTIAGWPNGLSPLQGAAGNLASAGALERYGADLATRGGLTWGVLTSDQRITERQAEIAQSRWIRSAANRRGAPAVLGNGLELKTLTLSPKDMALLDLRVFDEQRISSAFGVPPFLIGLPQPDGLTYANSSSLFDFHWRRLRPVAKRITNALSAWALPPGQKVHLNAGDYVQPSLQERTAAYGTMSEKGAMTTDEWRALENLPPLPVDENAAASAAASPFAQVGLPALIDAGIITKEEARNLLGLNGTAPRRPNPVAAASAGTATLQ